MERRMMALLLPWCDAAAFDGCSGRGLSGLRDDCQPLGDYFDDIPPDLSGQILFVVGQRTIPEDDDYNDLERALGAPDDRANVRLRGPVGPCVAQQYTTPRLSAIWARERIGAVVGAPVLQRCQAEGLAPVAKTFLEGGFRGGPREVGAGIAVIRKAVDAGIRFRSRASLMEMLQTTESANARRQLGRCASRRTRLLPAFVGRLRSSSTMGF
jgi:hypothetical protein